MTKRVGVYLRVSTDDQTITNQREVIATAIGHRDGWSVVDYYIDEGISGAKKRDKRPAYDKLLKDVTRRRIDVVAAWSVDRLGRSLIDLIHFFEEVKGSGADIYLHTQAIDTTTPAGKAMFQMLGVFAEFERSIIVSRTKAGLARVRKHGSKSGRPIGRPKLRDWKLDEIRAELGRGTGIIKTARLCGCGVSIVQKVKKEMVA
jgi:DNA invertase Pin-like site-specific DNA recombinase